MLADETCIRVELFALNGVRYAHQARADGVCVSLRLCVSRYAELFVERGEQLFQDFNAATQRTITSERERNVYGR